MQLNRDRIVEEARTRRNSTGHGTSTLKVICPFCLQATIGYTWNLSGSGKRCESCKNNGDYVILGRGSATMKFKTEKEANERFIKLKAQKEI